MQGWYAPSNRPLWLAINDDRRDSRVVQLGCSQGGSQRCVHAVTPDVQTPVEYAHRSERCHVRRLRIHNGRLRPKQPCKRARV